MRTIRIWDLPTRLFHWSLVACVVGLVITGSLGGNAMIWHFRFGYSVFSLLLFRTVWGFFGGRWSRFASFVYSPGTVVAFLRGERRPEHTAGHNPLGAFSVLAMLFFLAAQVATGLFSDDEIAFAGPLARLASSSTVSLATKYHEGFGKPLLIALITLHIAAIFFYKWKKKENLTQPMILGDKTWPAEVNLEPSRDDTASRLAALLVFFACAGLVTWVVRLGG